LFYNRAHEAGAAAPEEEPVIVSERAAAIADRVEAFVREVVVPYEKDPRCSAHGPSDELVQEMRVKAKAANLLTPHILADG
jgi:acyl-CoA dehydrogenase